MAPQKESSEAQKATVLIVDDEEGLRALLRDIATAAGYRCLDAPDGETAVAILAENAVDVVVTDIRMPGMSGVDLLHVVAEQYDADVIVMTGYASDYSYEKVISEGAADFVGKPCGTREFTMRIRRVLAQRRLRQERDRAGNELERTLAELRSAYLDTIHRLSVATEYKDVDTGEHIVRMGKMSALLAAATGMDSAQIANVRYAAPMHDVGKIGIPDSVLLKTGRLTPAEFEIMKTHTTIGAEILAQPKSSILACAREIALSHHECWDGSGYPRGLAGEDIPLVGRIVKLADVFDALVSPRPYKQAYPLEVALKIMKSERNTHFDPALLELFLEKLDEILAVRKVTGNEDFPHKDNIVWSERDSALSLGT